MNNNFVRNLAIATSLSIGAIACTPTTTTTTPTTSTSPTAMATPTTAATSSTTTTTTTTEKAPDTIRVSVINNSGKTLTGIYMAAASKKAWGPDDINEIKDKPIPDRAKADFEWKRADYKGTEAGCVFDVKAVYQDSKDTELDGLDLCKTPTINLN